MAAYGGRRRAAPRVWESAAGMGAILARVRGAADRRIALGQRTPPQRRSRSTRGTAPDALRGLDPCIPPDRGDGTARSVAGRPPVSPFLGRARGPGGRTG